MAFLGAEQNWSGEELKNILQNILYHLISQNILKEDKALLFLFFKIIIRVYQIIKDKCGVTELPHHPSQSRHRSPSETCSMRNPGNRTLIT